MSDVEYPEVKAGIAWMDEHDPGWAERIDLNTLALRSPENCVVCQVMKVRDFSRAWTKIDKKHKQDIFPSGLGFYIPNRLCGYGTTSDKSPDWWIEAENQWRRAIAERIARKP